MKQDEPTDETVDTIENTEIIEPNEELSGLKVTKKQSLLKRFGAWYAHHKKVSIPLTILLIIGISLAIPATRYGVLGLVWKEPITIVITDSQTHSPVSEATVKLDGTTHTSDKTGKVQLSSVSVGRHSVEVTKTYYESSSSAITVPLFAHSRDYGVSFKATGRLVTVVMKDRVTGKPVAGVLVDAGDKNQARSDDAGSATIVVPADKNDLTAKIAADGYLPLTQNITQGKSNSINLVPTGKIYFLSKQSGTIDVVSTNFDGSNRKTVVAGTGSENDGDTSLLASRDWKYLVLKSKREASKPASLYLIDTSNDSINQVDTGDANFTLIGWSDHRFLYDVTRNTIDYWKPKHEAVKSLNAESKLTSTLDETNADGDYLYSANYQTFANYYILDSQLTYTKSWYGNFVPDDRQNEIMSARPDGLAKRTLKTYQSNTTSYISAKLYKPQEVYYQIGPKNGDPTYVEMENGKIIAASDANFTKDYPTFLVSPDGTKTFWSESRDGKTVFFIGDKNSENSEEIASESSYSPYGWYTDNYLLVQKSNSELYITTKDQLKAGREPLKVSDYHKINSLIGYGYGYGGL